MPFIFTGEVVKFSNAPINVGMVEVLEHESKELALRVRRALKVRRYKTLPLSRFSGTSFTSKQGRFPPRKVRRWPRFFLRGR